MFTCSSAPAITLPALSSVPQVVAFDLYNDNACTISDWPVTSGNEGSCIPAIGPYHSARVFCQGQSVLYLDTACSLPYPYVFSPRNTSSNGACQLNGINGYMAIICSSSSPVTWQPTVVFLILCVVSFYIKVWSFIVYCTDHRLVKLRPPPNRPRLGLLLHWPPRQFHLSPFPR